MAAEQSDYKAMICLFLMGGNDSYNMLAPTNADEYAYYLATRGRALRRRQVAQRHGDWRSRLRWL